MWLQTWGGGSIWLNIGRTNRVSVNCSLFTLYLHTIFDLEWHYLFDRLSNDKQEKPLCRQTLSICEMPNACFRVVFRHLLGVKMLLWFLVSPHFSSVLPNYGTFPHLGMNSHLRLAHYWHVAVFIYLKWCHDHHHQTKSNMDNNEWKAVRWWGRKHSLGDVFLQLYLDQ